jgi:hypothetical protein
MSNGNNPYMTTESGESFDINAIINYLSGAEYHEAGSAEWYEPTYSDYHTPFSVNLPTYAYQGMSPEIIQALGNIFTIGDEGFDPSIIGENLITSQIEEQLNEQDWANLLPENFIDTQEEWDEATPKPTWGSGDFWAPEPTLSGIGDWDYDDMESALGFTNIFDPESIAATLTQIAGYDPDSDIGEIRPGEVKALTTDMIDKTTSAYYQPYEESEREVLIDKLGKVKRGVTTGGFAGSGTRQSGLSGAEKLYRGGYENIIADIMKMRGSSTEDVMDTIYGWQELIA